MINNENLDNQGPNAEAWRKLPIFVKASSILKLVEHLVEGIPAEECGSNTPYALAMFDHHTTSMMKNALLISVKIAGAEGDATYDQKMENATLIRKAANDILTDTKGLQIAGFKEVDYLEVLENEIEGFRPIFARWVKTFVDSAHVVDKWGLFNPPGLDFDEHNVSSDSH